MTRTVASLFSGGQLYEQGATAVGYTPLWGVEYDAAIAAVGASNTPGRMIVDDVRRVDFAALESPYLLHMSPVCTRASSANPNAGESPVDVEAAQACARAIAALRPPLVTLENVWGYTAFVSFRVILAALHAGGYAFDYWHLNAADYGVPQTRRRLVLVASRVAAPRRPEATHQERPAVQPGLFGGALPRWRGWYEAIEDILDTLPASEFAPWQLARLPEWVRQGVLMHPNEMRSDAARQGESPAFTLTTLNHGLPRAFLVSSAKTEWTDGTRDAADPAHAVTGESKGRVRALLVQGTSSLDLRDGEQPSAGVVATVHAKAAMPKAILVGSNNSPEPGDKTRADDEPAFTAVPNAAGRSRAWLAAGRVVAMTPRALARFQSVPDGYALPERAALACRVIGNGVPPLLAQRVLEAQPFAARP